MDVFAAVADERRIFASWYATLTPEQLATPSLCGEWTVADIGAHLLVPLVVSTPSAILTILTSGTFDRANRRMTAKVVRRPQAEIAAELDRRATSKWTPPGMGPAAPLADLLAHGSDARRPLGVVREIPADRLRTVLDFAVSPAARRAFVPNGRIAGLRLSVPELDWTWGDGPLVEGPGEAVLMAAFGRPAALADVTGDGVAVLASR